MRTARVRTWTLAVLAPLVIAAPTAAQAMPLGGWSAPVSAESGLGSDASLNMESLDGCPAVSADGERLYLASNRPGGFGGLDVYVAHRDDSSTGWGAPVNLGATVNSSADDFCPSPTRDGHRFFFVSARDGGCGKGDIYLTRQQSDGSWAAPVNLGCQVNSAGEEASPSLVNGNQLYFSSDRTGGVGLTDIYVSLRQGDGVFTAPTLAAGLNTTAMDFQPNVRRDGREIFFVSNRAGSIGGSPDIWTATRASRTGAWSKPVNLGPVVNSASPDTRPFLSWDMTTLYFGSPRPGGEGSSDLYLTTRERVTGAD